MMKARLLLIGFLLMLLGYVQAQTPQLIQGTIKPGANPGEIEVWLRPDFTNSTQYLFQIGLPIAYPASASPQPTSLNVTLDPGFVAAFGSNYSVTVNPVAQNTGGTEKYLNIVLIRGGAGASNPQTWTAGTEFKVLTATFVPSGAPGTQVKLADYQNGGSDQQGNFYTVSGNGDYYVTSNSIGNFYAASGASTVGGDASAGYAQTIATIPSGSCTGPSAPVVSNITTSAADIGWGSVGGAVGYEYALTTSSTSPTSGTATTSTSFSASGLTDNTTYYFHVRTNCGGGEFSPWVSTPFTTAANPIIQGSVRAGATPGDIEVWLKPNFSNSTEYLFQIGLPIAFPASAPVTPTNLTVTLDPGFVAAFGSNYSVTVNPVAANTAGTEQYLNIVLVREGAGASNPQTWTAGTEIKVLTASFVPSGAPGTQVKLADYQDGGSDGQGNFYTVSGNANYYVSSNSVNNFYAITGESEVGGDASAGYAQTVGVIPPTCTTPDAPMVSNITPSTADINWTAVGEAIGYEYAVTTSSTSPTSGTATTSTSFSATGLTAGTTYYIHLRSNCAVGLFSGWVSVPFTTQTSSCVSPSTPVVSNITSTSATINWTVDVGAIGSEYAVTTSSTPPASGTATTSTSFNATGLTGGTQYYAHIRAKCGTGNFSSWATKPFATSCGVVAVNNVVVSNITVNGATVNWNAVSGATGYEYAVTTSATPPTSGTATTSTSFDTSGLTGGTRYYVHLRTNCGSGGFSSWVSKAFSTVCGIPVVTVSVNGNGAEASWNAIEGVTTYEYALTTNMVPPLSGTNTEDTTRSFSGLKVGTTYYFHVRTYCNSGGFSNWTTEALHTEGIEVYPNPVRNTLTINLYGADEDVMLGLYDATGKLVMRIQVVDGNKVVDVRTLASGVYTLRYLSGGRKEWVRVVKR
jgi:hypothetical protein